VESPLGWRDLIHLRRNRATGSERHGNND
jgi:hypothetical protein